MCVLLRVTYPRHRLLTSLPPKRHYRFHAKQRGRTRRQVRTKRSNRMHESREFLPPTSRLRPKMASSQPFLVSSLLTRTPISDDRNCEPSVLAAILGCISRGEGRGHTLWVTARGASEIWHLQGLKLVVRLCSLQLYWLQKMLNL